jgi:DNA topoisomerase I
MASPNDCELRAASAGLNYVRDLTVGFTRRKCGKGFRYFDQDGKPLSSKAHRNRIDMLVIPPAWTNVWICPDADGHIQATGFDKAGRKQYIYHSRWHEASALHKYGRLRLFANLLPKIRRRVARDLNQESLCKERIVAAVVRLLDKASLRVGNKQYLLANESRGATTLTMEHVNCTSTEITLSFKGKSGKQIELTCSDDKLRSVIADCENSDCEFLFAYENEKGYTVPVTSSDVNSYLMEITAESITAKDFRTWRGSVVAFTMLKTMEAAMSKTAKKKFIMQAVKGAALALGNTPAVCRGSYIHSAILTAADSDDLPKIIKKMASASRAITGLSRHENHLVAFLEIIEEEYTNLVALQVASRKAA